MDVGMLQCWSPRRHVLGLEAPRGQYSMCVLGLEAHVHGLGLGLGDQVLGLGLGLEALVLGVGFNLRVSVMCAAIRLTLDRSISNHGWKW